MTGSAPIWLLAVGVCVVAGTHVWEAYRKATNQRRAAMPTPEVTAVVADIDGLTSRVGALIAGEVAAGVAPVQAQLDSAREVLTGMDAKVAQMTADHADDVAALKASVDKLAAALPAEPTQRGGDQTDNAGANGTVVAGDGTNAVANGAAIDGTQPQ